MTSFGLFLILISQTSVTVALPALSEHFGASAGTADWFLIAFMLSSTASILIFGRLSDLLGRKRIYVWGLVAFIIASIGATTAPGVEVFIAMRALQGLSAATILSNTSALITDAFPKARLAHAISINLTAVAVCNTAGPAIGGLLVSGFGWQAIFLVNLPFGILAVVLGLWILPARTATIGPRERFDLIGAVLSAVGLLLILYAFGRSSAGGHVAIACGILGLLVLVAFVVVEMRVEDPLVDLDLIRDVRRACAYGATYFNAFAWTGGAVVVALHQQIVAHRSPAQAGLVVTVMAIAMMVSTPVAGRLSARWSPRTLTAAGGALMAIGLGGLALFADRTSVGPVVAALTLLGLGIGLFTAPNTTAIMADVAPGRRTVANAVRSVMFNTAQAMSTSVALAVVTASGVTSYAMHSDDSGVVTGFAVAYGICALAATAGVVCGVARGGPWRAG